MAKKNPKEISNTVKLVGYLAEMELIEGMTEYGSPYLSVKGAIQFGEESYETLGFKLMSTESNSEGKESKSYPSMLKMFKDIEAKGLTIADGAEEPARLSVLAKFSDNYFWDTNTGEQIENTLIFSSYVKYATAKDENEASFIVDAVLSSIVEELDENEDPTGRLKVSGYTWDFNGRVIPIKNFIVEDTEDFPDLVEGFTSLYDEPGLMGEFGGTWKCSQVVSSKKAAFGKAKDRTFTRSEKVITSGSEPYDEDSPKYEKIADDNLKKAIQERQMKIDSDKRNPANAEEGGSSKKSIAEKASSKVTKKDVKKVF